MTESTKTEIASSFPLQYAKAELGIYISLTEFDVFESGIYAGSMDEKWNVFVLNNYLFFSRSWTGHCIYKIAIKRYDSKVLLSGFQVNRDTTQYKNIDIDRDVITLKKLIQSSLNRDDIYVNPILDLPLIKQTIGISSDYNRSANSSEVVNVMNLYQTLVSPPNDIVFDIEGWFDLRTNLLSKAENEQLTVVEIRHKVNGSSKTFYFDNKATEYLGCIIISKKSDFDWTQLITDSQ